MAAPVLPTPTPAARRAVLCGPRGRRAIDIAATACRLLRRRGWTTSMAGFRVIGDTDVRLLAGSPASTVSVEVLCPCPDSPDDAGPWAAVRIREDDRTVWRGPDRDCTVETLVRFVDDLVRSPDAELAQRYQFCG